MASIRQSVEVRVPLAAAYNQWTQFENFPRFMEGVREVRQVDDAHLHWRADRRGRTVEWDSEITEQVPDQRIVWRNIGGPGNHGSVRFQPLQQDLTRVDLEMELAAQLPGTDHAQHERHPLAKRQAGIKAGPATGYGEARPPPRWRWRGHREGPSARPRPRLRHGSAKAADGAGDWAKAATP